METVNVQVEIRGILNTARYAKAVCQQTPESIYLQAVREAGRLNLDGQLHENVINRLKEICEVEE